MQLRKATKADSKIIAEHLFLAMEAIVYEFIGTKDANKAKAFLNYFTVREHNQYSYTNCIVAEIENKVVGTLNRYDGASLELLRAPIAHYIKNNFGNDFKPENETQPGELYIDTLGVAKEHQGKGIGTKLLKHLFKTYKNIQQQPIGLLVEENNPKAETLYLSLGFQIIGSKTVAGKQLKHLQIQPENLLNYQL